MIVSEFINKLKLDIGDRVTNGYLIWEIQSASGKKSGLQEENYFLKCIGTLDRSKGYGDKGIYGAHIGAISVRYIEIPNLKALKTKFYVIDADGNEEQYEQTPQGALYDDIPF